MDISVYLNDLITVIGEEVSQVVRNVLDEYDCGVDLMDGIKYAVEVKGKLKRPLLIYLCYHTILNDMNPGIKYLAASIEMIHTASLIHDDILDEGEERRGRESVYKKFGIPTSVLAGDFLIFASTRLLAKMTGNPEDILKIINLLNDTYCCMCIGQKLEEKLVGNLSSCEDLYYKVIRMKTAEFFAAICESAGLLAGACDSTVNSLREFGMNLGIAYQIRDDVLGFMNGKEHKDKSNTSDAERQLITLPVILAYSYGEIHQREFLENFFNKKKDDIAEFSELKQILIDTGALDKTVEVINSYVTRAENSLGCLNDNNARTALIYFAKTVML